VSALGALLAAKLRATGHAVAAVRKESRLKVAFVALAATLLWLGAFAIARGSFRFLDRFGRELLGTPDVSLVALLVPRVLSVFALVLLVMLTFSSALLAYAGLYRSREAAFLATTPIPHRTLILTVLVDVTFFSSWSTAYLGSPVLLAYGLVRHVPWPLYVTAIVGFVPFVMIPAAVGTVCALLVAGWVGRLPRRGMAVAGVVVALASFSVLREQLRTPEFRESLNPTALVELAGQADRALLPSFWYKQAVLAAGEGLHGEVVFHALLLLANALLGFWLAAEVGHRLWFGGWSAAAGGQRQGRVALARSARVLERALGWLPPASRWLSLKDILQFARDPAQWSQVAIFFGVLGVYIANMKTSYHGYGEGFWQSWITMLNTVACLLVLATLTTRFVFPLLSLEGRRFWLLGLAPLPRRTLVLHTFRFSVATTSVVTLGLAFLSSWRLQLPLPTFGLTLFTVAAASIALSGLAVGLGSVFPNFNEDNPGRIVSGMGGTLTFILSAAYVVVVAGAQTYALRWSRMAHQSTLSLRSALVATAIILLATTIATLVPLKLGIRALERTEL
jgi:ABC-2 type transport system permease protein